MITRRCKTCQEERSYDPSAKPGTKASGFMGRRCWACYIDNVSVKGYKQAAPCLKQGNGLVDVMQQWRNENAKDL